MATGNQSSATTRPRPMEEPGASIQVDHGQQDGTSSSSTRSWKTWRATRCDGSSTAISTTRRTIPAHSTARWPSMSLSADEEGVAQPGRIFGRDRETVDGELVEAAPSVAEMGD